MKQYFFFIITIFFAANTFAQQKPNIIFILADDLGYGDLGCYGQQKIETPNIDNMTKTGIQFSQFYAGTAVCAPSRASFMTGMHTGHTDIRGNLGMKPEGQYPLKAETVTIANVLENAGYQTGAFGKWGLGYPGSVGVPSKKGFEAFFGYNCQSLAHNYYPDHLWENDNRVELQGNLKSDSVYSADLIHQHAIKFIQANQSKPFFLFLAYTLPHAALHGPHDSIYNYYVNKFHEQPVAVKQNKNSDLVLDQYPHAAYATMVTRLDKYVGEVFATLKALGIDKNTLVIFSSDNGPHHEGGNDPAFFNSSANLRGIKRDLYEGGIREPFLAVWPNKIKPGTKSSAVGAFWDLFPTFQELAGAKSSTKTDGISFVPALEGKPQKQHDYLYWEFHEEGGKQAVRLGKWKGIKLNVSTVDNPKTELYNIDTDPDEKINVADQHPEIVAKIDAIIKEAHVGNKDWPLLKTELVGKEMKHD